MKEDVLEQIVEDYLQHLGYFTRHNLRFRPDPAHPEFAGNKDTVPSDIDVIGIDPRRRGRDRVWVVSCKSWQSGFRADWLLAMLEGRSRDLKRPAWKLVRELWEPKWAEAFRREVELATGAHRFRYSIAVTSLKGDARAWIDHPRIRQNLEGSSLSFLTLEEMWQQIVTNASTTPAPSEIGRLAQLLKAANLLPSPARPAS